MFDPEQGLAKDCKKMEPLVFLLGNKYLELKLRD